jgi:nitrogen regulatory protein PII-like uncharacterized protein
MSNENAVGIGRRDDDNGEMPQKWIPGEIKQLIQDADKAINKYSDLSDKLAIVVGQVAEILNHAQKVIDRLEEIINKK